MKLSFGSRQVHTVCLLACLSLPSPVVASRFFSSSAVDQIAALPTDIDCFVDETGKVRVLAVAPSGSGILVREARQTDSGWSVQTDSFQFSGKGFVGWGSVAYGPSGTPHFAATHSDGVKYGVRTSIGWELTELPVTNIGPRLVSLDVSTDDHPHMIIEFRTGTVALFHVLTYLYNVGAGWNSQQVHSSLAGHRIDIQAPNDLPHIVYTLDDTSCAVRYLFKNSLNDLFTFEDLPPECVNDLTLSLALDTGGEASVAYVRQAPEGYNELRYVHRTAAGSWVPESVERGFNLYVSPALVLGDGVPRIAYSDLRNGRVLYAVRQAGVWRVESIPFKGVSDPQMFPVVSMAARSGGPVVAFNTVADSASQWINCAKAPQAYPPLIRLGEYQLWSIPLDMESLASDGARLSNGLEEYLGVSSALSWRAFSVEASKLIENPLFNLGRGYWINSLIELPAEFAEAGFPPSRASVSTIQLEVGWNTIGLPLDRPVSIYDIGVSSPPWSVSSAQPLRLAAQESAIDNEIQIYDDPTPDLQNNGGYVPVDLLGNTRLGLSPWTGVLIRAYRPVEICVGCTSDIFIPSTPSLPSPMDWELTLTAQSHGSKQSIVVGAGKGAAREWDLLDVPRPPVPWSEFTFAIEHWEWETFSDDYTKSVSSPGEDEYRWSLKLLDERGSGTTQISCSGLESLPSGTRAYLLFPGGAAIALDEQRSIALPHSKRDLPLDLIVTGGPWEGPTVINGQSGILGVKGNPVLGSRAGIQYQILAPVRRASLAIYDVQGRLVREFVDIPDQPGTWTVEWQGDSNGGGRVPSGFYVARLNLDQAVTSARIIVLP